VLWIRNVYPGSEFFQSQIPDPGSSSKNLSILTQKIVSKFSEILSGLFIPDPDPGFLPIPDPGSRGQKGTGSWIRIRNTDLFGTVPVTAVFPKKTTIFLRSISNCVVYYNTQRTGQGEPGGLRFPSALPFRREHPRPQIRLHRHPRHRRAAETTSQTSGRRTQNHLPLQLPAGGRRRWWRQIPPHGFRPVGSQLHRLGGAAFPIHHAARLHRGPI
jgi:hypothetical protein